jgi:hypothetical protein
MCKISIIKTKPDGSCFFHCLEIALDLKEGLRYRLAEKMLSIPKYKKHYEIVNSTRSIDYEIFEPISEILNINILVLIEEQNKDILYPFESYYSESFIKGMNDRKTIIMKFDKFGHFDLVSLKHVNNITELCFPFCHPFVRELIYTSPISEKQQRVS